jgi:NitT/TauT family transport system ATP-binding protein
MDEPFGALDSQTRSSMQRLLLRVWEHHHKTVLFVTHDIDEAILLGDRVYVMTARPGRIKAEIAVDIARPRSLDMVMDPEFIALKRKILGLIHDEIDDE